MEFVWQRSVLFSVCRKLPKCLAPSWTTEKLGWEQNRRTGEQVIVNSGRDSQKNRHASHGVKHLLINCGVFWSVLAHEMLHQGCQIKITNNWLKTSSWNPRSRFMNHLGSDDWCVILQLDLKVIWWYLMVETLYQCIMDVRPELLLIKEDEKHLKFPIPEKQWRANPAKRGLQSSSTSCLTQWPGSLWSCWTSTMPGKHWLESTFNFGRLRSVSLDYC